MSRFVRIVAVALVVVLALSVTGCNKNKNVAARVNGEPIDKQAIEDQMKVVKQQYPAMFQGPDADARTLDFRKRLLDTLISQELLRQAAADSGIKVSQAVVDQQVKDLRKSFQSEKAFEEALAKSGLTVERLKVQIRDQVVQQKLLEKLASGKPVTDVEITTYYNKNKAQFKEKAAVHAAHILFAENDKSTAQDVLEQVKDGGDFSALAKKYSKDTASAPRGGDLGWPTTPYVTEFQAAADALRPGQIATSLVHTPFGWHILKLIERRTDRQKPLSEVKEQIRQILTQQRQAEAYQDFLKDLRAKAKVEIIDAQLKEASAGQATTPEKK